MSSMPDWQTTHVQRSLNRLWPVLAELLIHL